jgi:predicted pyridoxine 5'-phosphate oxidase superfamily flavin-nucleotide-binding protein
MQIYITDKSGKRFWNTEVTAAFASGERANFAKRLAAIKSGSKAFSFIHSASARIVEELSHYDEIPANIEAMSDEELLAEIGI